MLDAKAQTKTIEAFFEGRQFSIPSYQRAYAWPDTHIRLLIDDLFRCYQNGGVSIRDEGEYFRDAERCAITSWLAGRYGDGDLTRIKEILREPYEWAHVSLPALVGGEERVPEVFRRDFFPFVDALVEIVGAQRNFVRHYAGFYSASLLKVPMIDALAAAVMKPSRKAAWRQDLQVVSRFLDTLAVRSAWSDGWCQTHGKKLQLVCEAIAVAGRNSGENLAAMLRGLVADSPTFRVEEAPVLTKSNKAWVRYFLCRVSDHFELVVRGKDDLGLFFGPGARPEIEHVMANYSDFEREFPNSSVWKEDRERLGALVILPKRVNASLRDAPYSRKMLEYPSQNALAASLSPRSYDGRLRFRGAKQGQPYPLAPNQVLRPDTIQSRTKLYCMIAENVWPKSFGGVSGSRSTTTLNPARQADGLDQSAVH